MRTRATISPCAYSSPGVALVPIALSLAALVGCQQSSGPALTPHSEVLETSPAEAEDLLASLRSADPLARMSLQRGLMPVLRFRGRLPLDASVVGAGSVSDALLEAYPEVLGRRSALGFEVIQSDRVGGGIVHRLARIEDGLRVEGGTLLIGVDATHAVTYLRHGYPRALPPRAKQVLSLSAAEAAASRGLLSPHTSQVEARVWVRGDKAHRGWHEAYRVTVHSARGASPLSAFAYVEVGTGEVVRWIDRLARAGASCVPCDATADAGCGRVFFNSPPEALDDPTLGNGSNVDAALQDCMLGNLGSSSSLDGAWANTAITGTSGTRISPPYDSLRSVSERAVDEVNAYFHADRAKAELDALGFASVMAYSVGIDAHDDQVGSNAYYDPQFQELHFGEAGVDFAQDPDVVYHEYGHAIQDNMVPGWGQSYVAGALGEGFGDYWAAAITDDSFATLLGPACTAAWASSAFRPYDGTPGSGCMRWVDGTKRFPEDQFGEVHADGEIWTGALWPLRGTLGFAVLDPMVVQSHTFLTGAPEFIDAADAMLAADQATNGGTNTAAIHQAMFARGLPRTATAPTVDGMIFSVPYACETAHDYRPGDYVECTFTQPGATKIRFHFSRFDTELDYDFVRISDPKYNEVEARSGILFGPGGGYSAPVSGDTIVARFFADPAVETWGFAIDAVSYAQTACSLDADCDDGVFCNGVESCDSQGFCRSNALVGLDDGVRCTVDACDEAGQIVTHVADDGICSDGRFCNGAETCDALLDCQTNAAPVVDDGVACTLDVCVERSDAVVNLPQDSACDDGLFCNGAEVCDPVNDCVVGAAIALGDGVACTVDACDEDSDVVTHVADDGACDDGLFCNGTESCDPVADCQDGRAPRLDDGVFCTVDLCDESADVVLHEPDDGACSDGVFCNGAELCDLLLDCRPGEAPVVDDQNACTVDTCDEVGGQITHAADPECGDPITGERVKGCGCSADAPVGAPAGLLAILMVGALALRRRHTIQ